MSSKDISVLQRGIAELNVGLYRKTENNCLYLQQNSKFRLPQIQYQTLYNHKNSFKKGALR